MRHRAVVPWVLVLLVLGACAQPTTESTTFATLSTDGVSELFIGEYVEGSGNNKALEIFNGTSSDVDLSAYSIQVHFNGSSSPGFSYDLAGTLSAGDAFVLAHASASPAVLAVADATTSSGLFNGDDAVVLLRGSQVVDSIGQVGVDPGSRWGSGATSTLNTTLRRNPGVCAGDPIATDPFDPASGWSGHPQDTFDGLGSHASDCPSLPYAAPEEPEEGEISRIFDIQGSGPSSPLLGQSVTIRGAVTGDFQQRAELSGFFVQELEGDGLDETSDGIFVFGRFTDVEVGDVVEVTGEVDEYFGLTELTDVTVTVLEENAAVEPTVVTLPLAEGVSWERYEGMLVTLLSDKGALVVSEVYHLGRGGLVTLADERIVQFTQTSEPDTVGYAAHREELQRRTIILDDGSTRQNPDPIAYSSTGAELTAETSVRVGDTIAGVTGVITYSFNGWSGTDAYRLHPTGPVEIDATNPRSDDPPAVGGRIQVASFNVLNFFDGDGTGGGFPTPRGADTPAELERQLAKLVTAILALDAEVVGLVEIENDAGPVTALSTLVEALNEQAGSGTYAYVDTGVIGTDQIKVALIYRPALVNPAGRYRVLNSTVSDGHHTLDPRFDDSRNRPALAQTFLEKGTGARFTVVVNHLKSKGSACQGDPDLGDGQGNCNRTREAAAEALSDWAVELAKESGDPDVIILGDLNAYMMEDPIRALLAGGFENLLDPDDYSYVFAGESGTLDHALATPSLASQVTGAATWGINTEEPSVLDYNTNFKSSRHVGLLYSDSPFRSSDHDPVLIGLQLERTPGRR